MPATILATQLYTPASRPNGVLRARLLQKMNASRQMGCKLILISAPAGFGKTTLVTAWVVALRAAASPPKVAWFSIDSGDNDLAIFLSDLLAALERCQPGLGGGKRQWLENAVLPSTDVLLPLIK